MLCGVYSIRKNNVSGPLAHNINKDQFLMNCRSEHTGKTYNYRRNRKYHGLKQKILTINENVDKLYYVNIKNFFQQKTRFKR